MSKVITAGRHSFVLSDVGCYYFETAATYNVAQPGIMRFDSTSARPMNPLRIADFNIIPRGDSNNFPDELRIILDEANVTPGVIEKQVGLLWGQGPSLYKIIYEDGKRRKVWVEDKEVESWLNSWNSDEYLIKAMVDFRHMNGHYTKYFRNRAPRIGGAGRIERLEHESSLYCALEWPDADRNINHIIVGDFQQPWKNGLRSYPVFNKSNPYQYPVSMRYSNMYSFALDNDYSRPAFYGTLNWIRLANSLPKLLTNYNTNAAALKLHVQVPVIYWEDKKQKLLDRCILTGVEYTEKMLEDLKDETFIKFTQTLSGVGNVGKLATTDMAWDDDAKQWIGWKIDPIDQKILDFVNAQLEISKRAALETTVGMGLHPALSNISTDGNLPSGSEQLYAFKLYLMTGVEIPEMIVCKDINDVIEVMFPGRGLKRGFYHDTVMTEEMTKPADRIKNSGPGVTTNK